MNWPYHWLRRIAKSGVWTIHRVLYSFVQLECRFGWSACTHGQTMALRIFIMLTEVAFTFERNVLFKLNDGIGSVHSIISDMVSKEFHYLGAKQFSHMWICNLRADWIFKLDRVQISAKFVYDNVWNLLVICGGSEELVYFLRFTSVHFLNTAVPLTSQI